MKKHTQEHTCFWAAYHAQPVMLAVLAAAIFQHALMALVTLLLVRSASLALLHFLPLTPRRHAAASAADLAFHAWLCTAILHARHAHLWPHTPAHYLPSSTAEAVRLHVFALGFYLAQSLLLCTDGPSKRRLEFFAHHALAGGLIVLALVRQRTSAGLLVLLVHSVFDPVFQAARILHFIGRERAAHRVLGIALYVFVATRLVFLPGLVGVYAMYDAPCAVVLSGLLVLHVYWARALAAVFRQFASAKAELGVSGDDARDDAGDDAGEKQGDKAYGKTAKIE